MWNRDDTSSRRFEPGSTYAARRPPHRKRGGRGFLQGAGAAALYAHIPRIACLLCAGLMESSGRLLTPEEAVREKKTWSEHLAMRDGKPVFLFDPQEDSVYLTQKDIREVQLAKGAISAGILLMERELGISHEQIQTVYIAGAFGNYMDPKSACDIGLLPPELRNRVVPVGNAAGEGAKLALLNRGEMEKTKILMSNVDFLELAVIPEFQDCFVDELEFPE